MSRDQSVSELAQQTIWPVDRIKDHAWKIGSGITPTGGASSYLNVGIPLLRSQNVHFDGLRLDDVAYIAEETHEEMSGTKLRTGDVLLNITGASIGRCSFVPEGFGEGNINQHVCIIRPSVKLNQNFLNYCLSAPWGQDQIFSSFTGASRQGLGQRDLGGIYVPLPPLPEQQRIAAYLDASCAAIDAAVAAKRRQFETLDTLRKTLIQESVTKGLDPSVEMIESDIDWIPEIPKHWNKAKLKRHVQIIRGQFTHRPRNDPAFYDGPYPFIQTGSISAADKFITEFTQTLNEDGLRISKLFPSNTVVMTITGAKIAEVAVTTFEACFPDSIVGFVPDHRLNRDYLYYLLVAMQPALLGSMVVTTQPNINYVQIGGNYVPLPPVREQESIAIHIEQRVQRIREIQKSLNQQIATLTAYRKSLIHECVTGQRRVTEENLRHARRTNSVHPLEPRP